MQKMKKTKKDHVGVVVKSLATIRINEILFLYIGFKCKIDLELLFQ